MGELCCTEVDKGNQCGNDPTAGFLCTERFHQIICTDCPEKIVQGDPTLLAGNNTSAAANNTTDNVTEDDSMGFSGASAKGAKKGKDTKGPIDDILPVIGGAAVLLLLCCCICCLALR